MMNLQKIKKITLALVFLSTLLISCEDKIDENLAQAIETYTTPVKFSIGEGYALEPHIIVLTLDTPSGEIQGAKVRFEKNEDGSFTTENWPLKCGDYLVKSWTAYSSENEGIARQDEETTFNPCTDGNILPEGILVELSAKEIPFNAFSFLNQRIVGRRKTIYDIAEIGDSDMVTLGVNATGFVLTKMNTKGDVIFHEEITDASYRHINKLISLANKEIFIATRSVQYGTTHPVNELYGGLFGPPEAIVGRAASDGSVLFEVTQDQLAAASDWETSGTLIGFGLKETPDGGFVYLFDGGDGYNYLYKIDGNGSVEWAKQLSYPHQLSGFVSSSINHLAVQSNGEIMLYSKKTGNYLVLEKFDASGNSLLVEDYSIGADLSSTISSNAHIEMTTDGGYVITTFDGDSKSLRLVKTDANGALSWAKTFTDDGPVYTRRGYNKSSVGSDGNILVQATLQNVDANYTNTHIKFFRVDFDGNIIAETPIELGGYGTGPDGDDFRINFCFGSFESTSNNLGFRGITFAGSFTYDGGTTPSDNWIAKFPSSFEVGQEINNPINLLIPN